MYDSSPNDFYVPSPDPAAKPPEQPLSAPEQTERFEPLVTPAPVPPAKKPVNLKMLALIVGPLAVALLLLGVVLTQGNAVAGGKAGSSGSSASSCKAVVGDYIQSLVDLNTRLGNVGMNQEAFGDAVGVVAIKQGRVDTTKIEGSKCHEAMRRADSAMDVFTSTNTEWNECIYDDYCDPDSLDVESEWLSAAEDVTAAKDLMNGKEPYDPYSDSDT